MFRFSIFGLAILTAGCNAGKTGKTNDDETGGGKRGALSSGQGDPFSRALNAGQRMQASNSLKQIGTAMHHHHDTTRALPSAGGSEKSLSWRVHLLPYLGQDSLYRQFRLKESWDSEHNRKLISQMPNVYNTPGTANNGKTAFHVFVGPGTPFGGPKPPRFVDIRDGTANTILAVFSGPEVEWTKPGGLEFNASNPIAALGSIPAQGLSVVLFDTSVRTLPASIDPKTLSLLIQHDDRQQIPQF